MQYVIIAIVVVAIALGLGMFFWKKKIESIETEDKSLIVGNIGDIVATDSSTVNEITIQMEQLPIAGRRFDCQCSSSCGRHCV